MEALETSKRFQLGVGPIRGLHWILCNIISHRCQSCLGLPLPPPPTCSCSSLLATQFSQGQLKSKVEYFYFLLFSFVCFIAREFEIPSSHMKKSSTPPGVGGGWAVTRRIVWCWLCKLESPDYHHTLSHARGQGEKILYIDTSKYDFDEKLPRLPGFAIVVGWQVTKIEKG